MATINIGTNKGNIQNVIINKPFNDIKYADVMIAANNHFVNIYDVKIYGWCPSKKLKAK